MTMAYTIAIDIGNTRTHLGLIDPEKLQCMSRLDLPSSEIEHQLLPSVHSLKEQGHGDIGRIVLAGGIRKAREWSAGMLRKTFGDVIEFKYNPELPVKFDYENINCLGADRIAHALYGNAVFPEKNLILISTGSAITVDLLVDHEFKGGTILPGILMQLQSLHKFTDALPEIMPEGEFSLPGRSTEWCIRAGVLNGTAGALNHIVESYKDSFASLDFRIVSTGGAWPLIEKLVNFETVYIPDMTLIGMSILQSP